MANWLKRIFGDLAAEQDAATGASASTPAAPAVAALPAYKDIGEAIVAGDAAAVASMVTENPQLLDATMKCGISKRNSIDVKPVHFAALLGKLDILQILHARGADLDEKAANDYTPLIMAARCRAKSGGGAGCAQYILDHSKAGINAATSSGKTALTEAAIQLNAETVSLLIQRGACANPADPSCRAALVAAATQHGTEIVRALLDQGVPVNAADSHNRTALWWALHTNGRDTAALLMDRGANVMAADKNGVAPLMEAAYRFNRKAVKRIIAGGEDVNRGDLQGNTALHWVTFGEEVENAGPATAGLLLGKGAWLDATNSGHHTPQAHAENTRKTGLASFLADKAKDPSSPKRPGLEHFFHAGTDRPVTTMKKIQLRPGLAGAPS